MPVVNTFRAELSTRTTDKAEFNITSDKTADVVEGKIIF